MKIKILICVVISLIFSASVHAQMPQVTFYACDQTREDGFFKIRYLYNPNKHPVMTDALYELLINEGNRYTFFAEVAWDFDEKTSAKGKYVKTYEFPTLEKMITFSYLITHTKEPVDRYDYGDYTEYSNLNHGE